MLTPGSNIYCPTSGYHAVGKTCFQSYHHLSLWKPNVALWLIDLGMEVDIAAIMVCGSVTLTGEHQIFFAILASRDALTVEAPTLPDARSNMV